MSRTWALPAILAVHPPGRLDTNLVEDIAGWVTADPAPPPLAVQVHMSDTTPGRAVFCILVDQAAQPTHDEQDTMLRRVRELLTQPDGDELHVVLVPPLYGENVEHEIHTSSRSYDSKHGWTFRQDPTDVSNEQASDTVADWLAQNGLVSPAGPLPDNPKVCDFCGTPAVEWVFNTPGLMTGERWHACEVCKRIIEVSDWEALARRANLPIPVPTLILQSWQAFAAARVGDAQPMEDS